MSTHNICFHGEIRKIFIRIPLTWVELIIDFIELNMSRVFQSKNFCKHNWPTHMFLESLILLEHSFIKKLNVQCRTLVLIKYCSKQSLAVTSIWKPLFLFSKVTSVTDGLYLVDIDVRAIYIFNICPLCNSQLSSPFTLGLPGASAAEQGRLHGRAVRAPVWNGSQGHGFESHLDYCKMQHLIRYPLFATHPVIFSQISR